MMCNVFDYVCNISYNKSALGFMHYVVI